MKKYQDISYTDTKSPAQMLDVYLPDAASFPVLIYFHGGGLEAGYRSGNIFYKALAQKGIAVVTADYRMYPDAAFPDYLHDAAAAVSWAYSHMSEYGQVTGYFIGGSSAGGYISQMLCFDKKYLAAHGIDSDKVDGYIHDAGQPTTHFNILRERGMDTRRIVVDEAAPLYHITGDRTFAPMQIIVSDNDMMNRPEQTFLLRTTLKHFGYEESRLDFRYMENSNHCAYVDAQDEQGEFIFARMISEFISARMNRH